MTLKIDEAKLVLDDDDDDDRDEDDDDDDDGDGGHYHSGSSCLLPGAGHFRAHGRPHRPRRDPPLVHFAVHAPAGEDAPAALAQGRAREPGQNGRDRFEMINNVALKYNYNFLLHSV